MVVYAGEEVAAADINEVIAGTTGKPVVRLIQQSAQSVSDATATLLSYGSGSEDIDTHGFHDTSTNPTRITPTVAGYYRCTVTYHTVSAAYTQLLVGIRKNGSNVDPVLVVRPDAASSAGQSVQCTVTVAVNGTGDYLEHLVQQNSSAARNTTTAAGFRSTFECVFERPL